MPYELEVTLRIGVNNDEEARRITEAVYSGMAAEILRVSVLYGAIPLGGLGPGAQPTGAPVNDEAKRKEASIELQDVETKVGKLSPVKDSPEPRKRTTSLAGVRRMGRK